MQARALRADALLLLTALIWGSGFVAQRLGLDSIGPMLYNGLRFGLGALAILPLAFAPDRRPHADPLTPRQLLAGGFAAGVLLFAGASLQQVGLLYTSVANAGFITGLYVIFVPLFGRFLGHHIAFGTWLGVLLAVLGMYFLSIQADFTLAFGDALQLAGAVFWAAHVLVLDHVAPRTHAVRLACLQFAVCATLCLVAAVAFEPIELAGIVAAAPAIAWGGLLSVAMGYTLQVVAQKDAIATHAAIILSLEAVFAALAGWLILGETLSGRAVFGCALMLAGMLVTQLLPFYDRRAAFGKA